MGTLERATYGTEKEQKKRTRRLQKIVTQYTRSCSGLVPVTGNFLFLSLHFSNISPILITPIEAILPWPFSPEENAEPFG